MTLKSGLEITRSRSLKRVIRKLGCDFLFAIVTMALSCIVCEIQRLIGRKLRNVYIPYVFSAPARGDPVGILRKCFGADKTSRVIGLPCSEETMTYRNVTDKQTDGLTDRQKCNMNIAHQGPGQHLWAPALQPHSRTISASPAIAWSTLYITLVTSLSDN